MSAHTKALALQAIRKASEIRTKYKCGPIAPVDVYALCNKMGVKVRFIDLSMEGLYGRGENRYVIYLSSLRPLPRRNFTCAHELGHHLFGHGSTIDELLENATTKHREFDPNESLVNAFAGALLIPLLGVRKAFTDRGWKIETASPFQVFTIACHFGVGYDTLISHLQYAVEEIDVPSADQLRKMSPKQIREKLIGRPVPDPLIIADQAWASPTLDAEVGTNILLPPSAEVPDTSSVIARQDDLPNGRLFRAIRPGIVRANCPGTPWATFIRISTYQFAGFAEYRHLEREDDDE